MSVTTFDNIKVLVVEDDQHMLSFLRAVVSMETSGIIDYAEATDGEQALKVLKSFKPDVIIADWIMEPMDGLELLQKIRQGFNDVSPFIPFIMVTCRDEPQWRAEARDAGVTEYLLKPVSAADLYQAIENAIVNHKPFVRSRDYFGPDRRLRDNHYSGDDRRKQNPVYLTPPILMEPADKKGRWLDRAS